MCKKKHVHLSFSYFPTSDYLTLQPCKKKLLRKSSPEDCVLIALREKSTNKCCYGNCLQWKILVFSYTFNNFPVHLKYRLVYSG